MNLKTALVVAAAAAGVALALGVAVQLAGSGAKREMPTDAPVVGPRTVAPGGAVVPIPPAVLQPLPDSLNGSEPDGELATDASGHLIVSPATRRFFDWFLTATGEEPDAAIRARLERAIAERLGPPADAEASALLARYLAYRERALELPAGSPASSPDELEAAFAALSELRRESFGARHARELFADEEAAAAFALAQLRIARDPRLSPEERNAALDELDSRLPPEQRAGRADARAVLRLREDEARLRAQGATPADIQRLREERFGPEAAARLEALDRERDAWRARLDDYRAARAELAADPTLGPDERTAAEEQLLAERFTPEERIRARVLVDLD